MRLLCLILSLAVSFHPGSYKKKRVALTFDDGPHGVYTAQILKILYEYGVQATFFTIGSNAERYPELVRAEYDLGHEIGNHTYSHSVSPSHLKKKKKKADRVIREITGKTTEVFRPPEGKISRDAASAVNALGKTTVLWDVDTRDWAHTPVDAIVENVKRSVRDGSVILFHDFVKPPSPTPEALRIIIPYLMDNGYEFVTVSALYHDAEKTGTVPSYFIG